MVLECFFKFFCFYLNGVGMLKHPSSRYLCVCLLANLCLSNLRVSNSQLMCAFYVGKGIFIAMFKNVLLLFKLGSIFQNVNARPSLQKVAFMKVALLWDARFLHALQRLTNP